MDSNQTRFHLLLGEADWSQCSQMQPAPLHTEWDPVRYEVTLERTVFRFPASKFDTPPPLERRRGAARDRYGNWYWIADSEQEIHVYSTGSERTSLFWRSGQGLRSEQMQASDFAAEPEPEYPLVSMRGLAVTEDHYLVAGVIKPAGLVIFDLYAGGPPQQFLWPEAVPFAPFDMAARPGGGVWILDRENRRYWGLDRRFSILQLGEQVLDSPPGREDAHYFSADEIYRRIERPTCTFNPRVSLNYSAQLAASRPVAIDALPDGTVIILDSPAFGASFSTVWHYRLSQLLGSTTTQSMRESVELDQRERFTLLAHDFAFVASYKGADGIAFPDRLYVIAADGNQTFAFDFVRDQATSPRLVPIELYLPMRLFGGKGLVAAGPALFYDFGERWVPLVPQRRHRYVSEATLLTPVFDGGEPNCTWHRLLLDGCLPPESGVEVSSRAANDENDLPHASWHLEPRLYKRGGGSELPWFPKPKKPNSGTWELLLQRAEGRFLQLRLRLAGNGQSTPRLRALRIYYPRFSYLKNYLPALYQDDAESASFLDRFLANPEGFFTAIEDKLAAMRMLFDLRTAPAEALDWLANWFGIALDPVWDEARRRLFVRHAMDLFQWRGTRRGLVIALRLAFEESPSPSLFTDAGANSACAKRFRIVEKFRSRSTPGTLLGDVALADAGGLVAIQAGQRWAPSQGAGELDRRYRVFLKTEEASIRFSLSRPQNAAAWEAFARQTLGFVPGEPPADLANWQRFLELRYASVATLNLHHRTNWQGFETVTLPAGTGVPPEVFDDWRDFVAQTGLGGAERLGWWQEFLARRYGVTSILNAAYGMSWPEFWLIPLPGELPSSPVALTDWFQFEGVVIPIRAAAHRFSVLLPATRLEATNSQERLSTLQLANRIVALEKPAHTVFDVKYYWTFFRVGEARLGDDTQLGQGSRAPELLPPVTVDRAFLAEAFLAPSPPKDARERYVLGRDPIFHR